MALIFEREWDSLSGFDNQLKSIRHYQLHPEMLPFIGRHYPSTKILMLGESHYLSDEESSETKKLQDWYNRSTQDYAFKCAANFDTRVVVHNYLVGCRSKAYTMFRNPTLALIEGWKLKEVNNSEAFTGFAFFNYFQRPASDSGDSISQTPEDEEQSYNILTEIIAILRPKKVVFLSKKSYDSYCGQAGEVDHDFIDYVYHPTSSYWNKENGRKKLCAIFSSMKRYNGFLTNGYLNRETTSQVLSTAPYRLIQKR